EEAVEAGGRGEIVIVVDDPARENEGDFVMAADLVTPEAVNFMTTHGRGIVCMPVLPERAGALGLNLLPRRGDYDGCAFTTSIDLADPPNTGTSAHDRAHCMARVAGVIGHREVRACPQGGRPSSGSAGPPVPVPPARRPSATPWPGATRKGRRRRSSRAPSWPAFRTTRRSCPTAPTARCACWRR